MGLKIEQLLEDEVEWELDYRKIGFDQEDKLSDKQRILRSNLRAIAKGAPDTKCELSQDLDLKVEQKTIERKFQEIKDILNEKGQKAKNFATFESRLLHFQRRVVALWRATKDPAVKQDVSETLLAIRKITEEFFGSGEAASKSTSGLASQNDVFDLCSDQAQSENDTSKGAIKKKPTESTARNRSDGNKKERIEKERRLEKMLSETGKKKNIYSESKSD
jgi:hypothetical protein